MIYSIDPKFPYTRNDETSGITSLTFAMDINRQSNPCNDFRKHQNFQMQGNKRYFIK